MKTLSYSAILFLFFPLIVHAEAVLYVSPERGYYGVGDIFEVRVLADTGDDEMNAAEAELTFDPNELYVEYISTEGSVLSLWPTPPIFSNETGTIRFSGWTAEKYSGKEGLLATIVFRTLRVTLSNARLAAGAILAADGRGSNIVTSMKSGIYAVGPRVDIERLPYEGEGLVAGTSVEAVDVTPPETPILIEYPYGTIDVGERAIVRGSAPPNSTILVWLARGDEPKVLARVQSAADGSFTFVSDSGLEEGIYRLWAQTADENGMQSEPSKRIRFDVRPAGFFAAAVSTAGLATALVPLFILLLIAGLGVAYIMHRHRVEKMNRDPNGKVSP